MVTNLEMGPTLKICLFAVFRLYLQTEGSPGKKVLKKKRSNAKGKFHRILNRFNKSHHNNESKESLELILKDLEDAYSETEGGHASYLEVLDSDDETDKDIIEHSNTDMDHLYQELCEARSMMGKVVEAAKVKDTKPIEEVKCTKDNMRVKKLDAPVFSGNIRDYPSFKQDYNLLMKDDPFTLKQCLTGEALLTVKGVDNDFTEMMKRLDIKYGKPEKLADAVLSEIKGLKPMFDGDYMSFITTVDVVERCWLDLKRMNMELEMNTATMISQIERLLPPLQKRVWALRKQKYGSHTFPELLNFLLEEKNAMEYIHSDLRDSSASRTLLKSKVHNTTLEEDSAVESLQAQVKQNQETLKQVVDGLAQVAEVMSHGNKYKQNGDGMNSKNNMPMRINRRNCWYHETDNHDIGKCTAFSRLDGQTKIDLIRKQGGCFSCLKIGHLSRYCSNRKPCDVLDENQQMCGRMHHQALHGIQVNGSTFHNCISIVNGDKGREDVLLMISRVPSNGNYLTALWDPGANISLITHDSARRLNLKGRDVTLSVTKVGNTTDYIQSKEYIVPLTDLNGQEWKIRTYGMDQITADVTRVDIRGIAKLFKGVTEKDVVRPEGKVDILIGSDCCVLLPTKAEQVGNLQLMKNQFGYCLRGSHTLLKVGTVSHHYVRIHHLYGQQYDTGSIHIANFNGLKESLDNFFNIESLGTQCNPKCGNCKCGKCPIGNGNYTIAEERELNMIRKGLHYDKGEKRWTVTYPWIRESAELPNNIGAANHRLESTEKRLQRTGTIYANAYNDQIRDMVNRNVARKLSDYEVRNYEGPIHYLPHHEVLKPDSKSTPIRIVFNSSSTYMGHVINDYWAKGPNVLNDMLVVLLRFRQNRIGIAGDISKMYNAIKLSVSDQHTHRFLWRDLDASRKPDHYVLKTVTFGDRPCGTIATVALGMTAEMSKDIYPEAAEMILRNSYVDDIINSVDNNDQARKVMEDTEKLLAKGGFTIKHWIVTGKQSDQWNGLHISNEPKEKILGMIWQPRDDMFTFQAKINFSSKRRGIHIDKDLQQTQIDDIPLILTRRMVLSQVASIYDPLGLASPFVLTAKLLLRSFCKTDGGNGGWDEPIADAMRQKWIEFFKGVFQLESIQFPRCIKPEAAYKNPVLVVFSDGSSVAYGACAYIRWQIGPETYEANLIIAKNRIAPTKQLSIPRLELCGAVIASRIREKIVKEMDFNFIRIIHVVDSTIVRAQIQRESYGFGTFVATRIAEIQSKTEPSDWWWVQGEQNPADLTTRATDPTALVMESVWQKGPDFLRLPIEQWPIRQDYSESSQLPDAVGITMSFEYEEKSGDIVPDLSDIDLNRFSNVSKMLRVTSIILDIAKNRSFKGAANRISAGNIQIAEMIWIKHIQKSLPKDSLVRFRRLGVQTNSDGIITVGQRMQEWMKRTWNQTEFILLPISHPFIKLIVGSFHSEDHSGVDTTLAKLRSRYWIPGVRRIIKLVKKRCIICRKREKKIVGQQMGMLPIERLQPAPAFYYCAVDLFGPFMIRDTVKKRTHGKAYGVLFNCLTTRAVYVDLAEGYDTSSFIMTLRRFVTVRGYPRKMISDSGSQLVAAGKELQQVVHKWDWEPIKSFGECKGMDWVTTKSADAPWENGVSESLVKSVKKSLEVAIGTSVMTFSELQTVLFEVSNLLNERPIGTKNSDPMEGSYLCPNDLLLGRSSIRVPNGNFNGNSNYRLRWKFIQQVVQNFWKKWTRDFFPTLILRQKWHTKQRNVKVGDLVIVQDSNIVRGRWKMAQIIEANAGRDGFVRDVILRYKNVSQGVSYNGCEDQTIRRSVHRLVVILPVEEQLQD